MLWRGRRESSNVEDLRSEPVPYGASGGRFSLFSLPIGNRARLILFVAIVGLALISGANPLRWLNGDFDTAYQTEPSAGTPENDDARRFVAVVLADTEDVWAAIFKERGATYSVPKLVLFRDAVRSDCGFADAAVGPFYCPIDGRVYIDLGFLNSLQKRLGAPGDFAEAYVIAHEIGHHVQRLLGKIDSGAAPGNNGSEVRTELQADCYAGIWAHYTERMQHTLEPGDIDEAVNAASAVGDDRLQKRSQGYVVPDSFTHGTSAQRQRWFKQGYESGKLETCDTFSTHNL